MVVVSLARSFVSSCSTWVCMGLHVFLRHTFWISIGSWYFCLACMGLHEILRMHLFQLGVSFSGWLVTLLDSC